jgi:hypothetical protein
LSTRKKTNLFSDCFIIAHFVGIDLPEKHNAHPNLLIKQTISLSYDRYDNRTETAFSTLVDLIKTRFFLHFPLSIISAIN